MSTGARGLSRDAIKYIAIIAMTFNHIAFALLKEGTLLFEIFRDIGSFTAITMCYYLVEGYQRTSSRKAYALRLLVFALLSQIPYYKALGFQQLNVMFTLLICFGILYVREHEQDPTLKPLKIALLIGASAFCDWAVILPAETLLFAGAAGDRKKTAAAYAKIIVVYFFIMLAQELQARAAPGMPIAGASAATYFGAALHSLAYVVGMALSGVVVLYFSGDEKPRRFRKWNKWFFYVYYPAHLTVIGLVKYLMFRGI